MSGSSLLYILRVKGEKLLEAPWGDSPSTAGPQMANWLSRRESLVSACQDLPLGLFSFSREGSSDPWWENGMRIHKHTYVLEQDGAGEGMSPFSKQSVSISSPCLTLPSSVLLVFQSRDGTHLSLCLCLSLSGQGIGQLSSLHQFIGK